MVLPPGTSWPGVRDACFAPQLTEQPGQAPSGVNLGGPQALEGGSRRACLRCH